MNDLELYGQAMRSVERDQKYIEKIQEKRLSWLRWIVSTIGIVVGIMVSFSAQNVQTEMSGHYTRLAFSLTIVLFVLSILFFGVAMYSEVYYLKKARALHAQESRRAFAERRRPDLKSVAERHVFGLCETLGYISCVLALVSLTVYVLLPFFL